MEAAEGESKKSPDGGEKRPKRKMKTAYQLELLEKTYAVSTYPSESLRVELSVKLGLSDRQLQMWFCHRRLKDRKASEMVASVSGTSPLPEPRKAVARMASPALAKIEAEMSSVKRYYEPMHPPLPPAPTMLELRAITFVESQLGEPIREDGPILGVEFDPLPPGAFGAPIESSGQQKLHGRPYEGKPFERHDPKSIKTSSYLPNVEHCFLPSSCGHSAGKRKTAVTSAHIVHSQGPRALHEYQFLPEQPSVRSEGYERIASSHFYDSPVDNMSGRLSPLPTGGPYLHGNEQVGPSYTFQGQTSSAGILPQQGRQHNYPSGSTEYEIIPHKASFTSAGGDALFDSHHIVGIENAYLSSDRTIIREEDATRIERKRKSDEARIAKEVEAHEKRIRRELEKQDVLRRKREEQMRREMERHDRERRKEEERLLREKQREEERFQREQRRENERREKFLQKENRRAEKLRRKEEMRREKEAARIRAAHERATARRIAREYMELIEDERLELMELAASNKGLHSIIFLDSDTLQSLHMFRDMLSAFPPKSVQLLFKKPFAVEPWTDSDENIGNLLMVWRFLITFADVLALWPFTLDEFVQAFHDYDPRLLGEIHMALLKSIIKDIEDVARTPAVALGANQNSAANPGGGHPQIVEGAYAWGFDIRCWQRHLNPLTWPEVLRQFALSAGFGPQLKKSVERAYFRDENEGHDGEDIISTLRNGSAAENAVALMREKGFSRLRRSRHRLTPGTVKFAAFHVLSLEGSKGLTILEVADKIQKSGLRDLTTSKTPEASIAAALSRDSKLFERTAPSTYCVKPQFRKDPADADAVLAAAREKMKVFENGLSDSEEAEKDAEDADEAERDEDSESDGADDLEVDDVVSEEKLPKEDHVNKIKVVKTSDRLYNGQGAALGTGVGMTSRTGSRHLDKSLSSPFEGLIGGSVSGTLNNLSFVTASDNHEASNADQDGTEIDESDSGEPWVQGLMEGEYSDLSVEERLNALVALIGMAIEGNSIRVVLEERLEAANALKKQMWAEAQLDKRRMKEEYMTKLQYSSFVGIRSEAVPSNVITEGSHSPLLNVDNKSGDANLYSAVNNEASDLMPSQNNGMNVAAAERNVSGQEFSVNIDTAPLPQYGYAAEKSRSQLKSYIGHRAEEMYVYRSLPLGQDRRRNRYWQFVTSASRNDPGSGRIFFESKDGLWRLIDSEEAFDALLAALDTRGIRESHLHSMLTKIEMSFKETLRENLHADSLHSSQNIVKKEGGEWALSPQSELGNESPSSIVCCPGSDALDPSMSFRIELGKNDRERNVAMRRYQDFQKWLWKECFNSATLCAMKYGKKRCSELLGICYICYQGYFFEEKHCLTCHKTFKIFHGSDRNFTEHVSRCEKQKADPRWKFHNSELSFPMRVQTLKVQLSLVEACIPLEALQQFWSEGYRKSWGVKLQSSSSADDLLQLLTLLEGALKRDYLSSNYETTNELLSVIMPDYVNNVTLPGSVNVLPWIPQTTAAVGLRLMELDASISYMLHQKVESHKEKAAGEFIKIPSRYAVVKNMQETEISEIQDAINYHQGNWAELGSGHSHARKRGSRGRGGGRGRGRGSRGQRRSFGLIRAEFKEAQVKNGERTTRKPTRRGRTRGRGRNRGRRTVRTRRRSESRVAIGRGTRLRSFGGVSNIIQQHNVEESPRSSAGEEWDGMEAVRAYADEDNSVEPYDSDENGQASSDENSQASSDENGQASGDEYDDPGTEYQVDYVSKSEGLMDDDSEEEDADEDEEGEGDDGDEDMDIDGRDGGEIGDDDVVSRDEGNEEDDEDATSFSSEYSD